MPVSKKRQRHSNKAPRRAVSTAPSSPIAPKKSLSYRLFIALIVVVLVTMVISLVLSGIAPQIR